MADNLSLNIVAALKKGSKGDTVQEIETVSKGVRTAVNTFGDQLLTVVILGGKKVAQIKADEALKDVRPMLIRAGLADEARELRVELNNFAQDVERRMPNSSWAGDGRTLKQRIKTIQSGTQKTVLNIIENGVKEGKGAREIAKRIEQYVVPTADTSPVRPFDEYRERFGRAKTYTPRGVPSGSVSYNAIRIARTETAHIYRSATLDFYRDKDYVIGYRWYLSNSHSRPDECDTYSRVTYKTANDVPEHPHPMCMCDVRPVLMSHSQLKSLLNSREKANGRR